ncbi:MAG: restriction endonuclease, SacI family [Thermodesulfobacteriota bacterium]|nr:restriction endonuclease, SacI family [Thermodesulfobacteriota bacterium]
MPKQKKDSIDSRHHAESSEPLNFNAEKAQSFLREQASLSTEQNTDASWVRLFRSFSKVCEGTSRTHIAFLGTALLAKSLDININVFSVKAREGSPGAYSTRSLGHGVLVPLSTELGINLGVTGREPLNNQPYFQIDRVSRNITVHAKAKPAVEMLCDILDKLAVIDSLDEMRQALRSYIFVRRGYVPHYPERTKPLSSISPDEIISIIEHFVSEDTEGGKRAQAVVAGLLDLFAGTERVVTDRINDPDRHLPGDVGVKSHDQGWEKIFEVRDKPVKESDAYIFAEKALKEGICEAAIIAVAKNQPKIDFEKIRLRAKERGLGLSFFTEWHSFIKQVLFWSELPQLHSPEILVDLIYTRLIQLEVSQEGVQSWIDATGSQE